MDKKSIYYRHGERLDKGILIGHLTRYDLMTLH